MAPAPLGTFTDYASFVALLRARKVELGLSDLVLDELAGMTGGYCGKVFNGGKGVGPISFTGLMNALGLVGALYAAPKAGQRERRREASVRTNQPVGRQAIARARPVVMRELAIRGGKARWAGVTEEQRLAAGRQLAEARQRKAMSRHMGESASSAVS